MATPKNSLRKCLKFSKILVSNIELFPLHIVSELGVLGIAEKLKKNVVQSSACPNRKRPYFGCQELMD